MKRVFSNGGGAFQHDLARFLSSITLLELGLTVHFSAAKTDS